MTPERAPELMERALMVLVVLAVMVEAVTMAPVVPETVKLEVSTAIPPSRLTKVVVVAPLPVTVARVSASVPVTVMVVPTVPTLLIPAPTIVRAPVAALTKVTPVVPV